MSDDSRAPWDATRRATAYRAAVMAALLVVPLAAACVAICARRGRRRLANGLMRVAHALILLAIRLDPQPVPPGPAERTMERVRADQRARACRRNGCARKEGPGPI